MSHGSHLSHQAVGAGQLGGGGDRGGRKIAGRACGTRRCGGAADSAPRPAVRKLLSGGRQLRAFCIVQGAICSRHRPAQPWERRSERGQANNMGGSCFAGPWSVTTAIEDGRIIAEATGTLALTPEQAWAVLTEPGKCLWARIGRHRGSMPVGPPRVLWGIEKSYIGAALRRAAPPSPARGALASAVVHPPPRSHTRKRAAPLTQCTPIHTHRGRRPLPSAQP